MTWKKLEHSICDHVYTFLLWHYYSFENQCSFRPTAVNLRSLAKKNKLFHKIYVFRTFSNIVRWQFGRCCWVIFTWISRFSYLHMIIRWLWNMFEYIKLYALTHTVLPHIYILRKPRKSKRSLLGIITSNVNYNFFLYVYILFLDSFLPFFLSNFWNSSIVFPWYFCDAHRM